MRTGRLRLTSLLIVALGVLGLSFAAVTVAKPGNGGPDRFRAALAPVPHPGDDGGSNASAFAKLHLRGTVADVLLQARGLSGDLPHAMHIHGKDSGELAFCPGAGRADELRDDGLIETAEGLADYGPVQVSLTTAGDTSADSVLALDRFAVAKDNGKLTYRRSIRLPEQVARDLDEKHIVIHGEDLNGNGTYDAEPVSAGLKVPLEAELPVACGEIRASQSGRSGDDRPRKSRRP